MEKPLIVPMAPREPEPSGAAAWGTPTPLLHRSITDIDEQDFIALVLESHYYRRELFNIKDVHGDRARKEPISAATLNEFKPGTSDVDIAVFPENAPELTTVFEVKRFKADVDIHDANLGHPSRMNELMVKGIKQANGKLALGFSQVYLAVFVLIDTRKQNGGQLTFAGPRSEVSSKISSAISRVARDADGNMWSLDERVGLIVCDWVQSTDAPVLGHGGSSGIHLRSLATRVPQDPKLTEWIRSRFYRP